MSTEHEAVERAATKAHPNDGQPHGGAPRVNWIGRILGVLSLTAAAGLLAAVDDRGRITPARAQSVEVTAVSTVTTGVASPDHRHGPGNAKLFLGYLEFDWDPDAPGGVPGFGPLPPTSTDIAIMRRAEN